MKKHALAVLAYGVATFVTQALSHFVVNKSHYAGVAYLRPDPIFPLGVAAMLIQGSILSYLYVRLGDQQRSFRHAVSFGWVTGGFLVSYIALTEAAKYAVPAIGSWIAVEATAGLAQFTLYGLLLGLVYRVPGTASTTRAKGNALQA